jgi:hypothetical protein
LHAPVLHVLHVLHALHVIHVLSVLHVLLVLLVLLVLHALHVLHAFKVLTLEKPGAAPPCITIDRLEGPVAPKSLSRQPHANRRAGVQPAGGVWGGGRHGSCTE